MKKSELICELAAVIHAEGLSEDCGHIKDLLKEAGKYGAIAKVRQHASEESEYFETLRQANIAPI